MSALADGTAMNTGKQLTKSGCILWLAMYLVGVCFLCLLRSATSVLGDVSVAEILVGPAITATSGIVIWLLIGVALSRFRKHRQ